MGTFTGTHRSKAVTFVEGGNDNHKHEGKANWFHMGLSPHDPKSHLFICIKAREHGARKGELCAQTMIEPHGGRIHLGAQPCQTCQSFPVAPLVPSGGGVSGQ